MIDRRHYAEGTFLDCRMPFSFFVGGRAMCADGKVRALARISETADTFFSIPAAVKVKGRTVSGYVTFQTHSGSDVATADDPALVRFRAYTYGANGALLTESESK